MIALSKHRLSIAKERLNTANLLIDSGDYKSAANRSYYAIFHTMRAVLILEDVPERSKHSGVIALFQQRFLKTGILDKSLSRIITDAFEVRNEADYDVSYIISKDEVLEQIRRVGVLMEALETYLKEQSVVIPE
jgi:uncharacterized protein (UPF0332 family)